jgi:hypothetical protein
VIDDPVPEKRMNTCVPQCAATDDARRRALATVLPLGAPSSGVTARNDGTRSRHAPRRASRSDGKCFPPGGQRFPDSMPANPLSGHAFPAPAGKLYRAVRRHLEFFPLMFSPAAARGTTGCRRPRSTDDIWYGSPDSRIFVPLSGAQKFAKTKLRLHRNSRRRRRPREEPREETRGED